jgi:SPP1 family predicted phage head-tail adaptor
MKPGKLDQRITIQGPSEIDDGYGGTIPGGMADLSTEWASVEPLRGTEAVANMAVTANQTYRIWVRRNVAVSPTHQLVWEGRTLNIREAPPPRREAYRQIIAVEMEA